MDSAVSSTVNDLAVLAKMRAGLGAGCPCVCAHGGVGGAQRFRDLYRGRWR
jgi:hypothetical protein